MSADRLRAQLQTFFDDYRDAFNSGDAPKISSLYRAPSLVVTPDGSAAWLTAGDVLANMQSLLSTYDEDGFVHAAFQISSTQMLGTRNVVVDVEWTVVRKGGLATRRFRTGYNLSRNGESWRIDVCTAYEEQGR